MELKKKRFFHLRSWYYYHIYNRKELKIMQEWKNNNLTEKKDKEKCIIKGCINDRYRDSLFCIKHWKKEKKKK